MPYCSVNGIRIYYEVSGEGFPLLLIHANPFDHRLWLYQIASFSTFFKVIAVDLRCYGHSDKPASKTSLAMMAEDVMGAGGNDMILTCGDKPMAVSWSQKRLAPSIMP